MPVASVNDEASIEKYLECKRLNMRKFNISIDHKFGCQRNRNRQNQDAARDCIAGFERICWNQAPVERRSHRFDEQWIQ